MNLLFTFLINKTPFTGSKTRFGFEQFLDPKPSLF